MKLHFTKMQALGNDFIIIDDRASKLSKLSMFSKKLCDRRFGIGADQLLLLYHSRSADFRMRIFNADGSEVEMCGNGVRCLGKYIWDEKTLFRNQHLSIETKAGIIYLEKKGALIKVDMGKPILEPQKIPVIIGKKANLPLPPFTKGGIGGLFKPITNYPLKIKNRIFKINCVSMGNPHTVIVVKDVQSFPLEDYGPLIEKHNLFPKRTNVEFIQTLNQNNIKMRVWERGAGETMACGTGASAAAIVSYLLGLTRRKITVHLPGGKLKIEWSVKDNHIYMTGPAVKVFEGTMEI